MTPTCPSCGKQSLRRHCPPTNLTCPWDECINVECKACIDRVTGQHSHPLVSNCKACGPVVRRPAR